MNWRKILPYSPKLVPLAKKLWNNMTFPEVLLWQELKGKQMLGYDFDKQIPIDNYLVGSCGKDFLLAVEIDVDTHTREDAAA